HLRPLLTHPVEDPRVERFVPEIELEHPLAPEVADGALQQGHLAAQIILSARRGVKVAHRRGDPIPVPALALAQVPGRFIPPLTSHDPSSPNRSFGPALASAAGDGTPDPASPGRS